MEVLLKTESVEWKEAPGGSTVGTLEVLRDSFLWRGEGKSTSQPLAKVKGQKVSPESKRKVMLQLTFLDASPAHTFVFLSPQGQAKQVAERNAVKELLLQLLPAARAKAPAAAAASQTPDHAAPAPGPKASSSHTNGHDSAAAAQGSAKPSSKASPGGEQKKRALDERNVAKQRLLKEDKALFRLYQELVGKGVISASEFWAEVASERLGEEEAQKVGVPPAFLCDVTKMDGCNGLKLNLTPDIIAAVFKTYPAVKRKHLDSVPHEMDEKEFWSKFFQSHYFHRDRSLNPSPLDLFGDCVKADETDMAVEAERAALSSRLCDLGRMEERAFVDEDDDDAKRRPGDPANAALVRRFNYHSTRVLAASLHSQPSSSSAAPAFPGPSSSGAALESAELAAGPSDALPRLELHNTESFAPKASAQAPLSMAEVGRQRRRLGAALDGCAELSGREDAGAEEVFGAAEAEASLAFLREVSGGGRLAAAEWSEPDAGLSRAQREELGTAYAALSELLRHFWTAFPANSAQLEEKVQRFGATLDSFAKTRLRPLEASLAAEGKAPLLAHLFAMLQRAQEKLKAWQAKRTANAPAAKKPKPQ